MIGSLSMANIMLTLGVILCPLLLTIIFVWFLGLAILEIRSKIIKYRLWKATPCPSCIYFVDCQELKCAVNPDRVLTKNAVDCQDFQPIVGARVHDYRIKNH